jgi:23S rRNA (cytidine2498-2'-O)-methyltransferase
MRKGHGEGRKSKRGDSFVAAGRRPNTPERIDTPPRVHPGRMPSPPAAPGVGAWVWTCRAGFEPQLFEELAWAKLKPTLLGPGLVACAEPHGLQPTFARMGFRVEAVVETAAAAAKALPAEPTRVQVWAPDTDAGNALTGACGAWEGTIGALRRDVVDSRRWAGCGPATRCRCRPGGARA